MRRYVPPRRPSRRLTAVLAAVFGAALLCAATLLPASAASPAPSAVAPQTDVVGNATHFDGLGQPYGGCGMPQTALESQDFVALNVFNTPGDYGTYPRPLPPDLSSKMGTWDNGHNCGRWVKVTIGDYCTGTNDGAPNEPFCRNGSWTPDSYNGATLDMLVADSCADANAWCRDDPNHLDLVTSSLGRFQKNGSTVTGLADHWNNRHISWSFEPAPNYSGDIRIGFLQGAQRYWPAIAVSNLPNGLHGIEYQTSDGAWHDSQMDSDMGQAYIIAPTTSGGTDFTIRVRDASDAYLLGGRTYSFSLPASCGSSCSAAYTGVTYTTGSGGTTTGGTTTGGTTTGGTTTGGTTAGGTTTGGTTTGGTSTGGTTTGGSTTGGTTTGGCTATYKVSNSWPGGYQVDVQVLNSGTQPTSGWAVKLALPSGVTIGSVWNAAVDSSGPATTVRNVSYNGTLAPAASTSWGMTLNGSDQNLGTPACTAS